jgi:enolase
MAKIKNVNALEVLDSRGNPTIRAEILTDEGHIGSAIVPSGASTGEREALEMRDGDRQRYLGRGVRNAVGNIKDRIAKKLIGQEVSEQENIDQMMIDIDGTPNKSELGANAMLAVSMATAHAASADKGEYLFRCLRERNEYLMPVPLMNVINGGMHANNNIDFQEFMIVPAGAPTFGEAVRYGTEVFHTLKALLEKRGFSTAVGDEGGFAPSLESNEAALKLIVEAIESAGYKVGEDIFLGLDVASSEFYHDGEYCLQSENKSLSPGEMTDLLVSWCDRYPIVTIEDGMDQNDWDGWKILTEKLGEKVQLVGDDLFVTDANILQKGIDSNLGNSILIKVNQIGTLTETFAAIELAQENNYTAVVSHRSGETEDTTIADIAVAYNAGQIKTGSMSRSDRIAKYNLLLLIENELQASAVYPGLKAFSSLKNI